MHFFNPVPLMRLVEVIPGLKTAPWVRDAMMTIGKRMTREPVLCTRQPGVPGQSRRPCVRAEAQRLLTENIAGVADIDRILTGAPGFKLGPFSLADMVGIDIQHGVMESVYGLFYGEADVRPVPGLGAAGRTPACWDRRRAPAGIATRTARRSSRHWRPAPKRQTQPVWMQPSKHHPDLQAPLLDTPAPAPPSRPGRSPARMP